VVRFGTDRDAEVVRRPPAKAIAIGDQAQVGEVVTHGVKFSGKHRAEAATDFGALDAARGVGFLCSLQPRASMAIPSQRAQEYCAAFTVEQRGTCACLWSPIDENS